MKIKAYFKYEYTLLKQNIIPFLIFVGFIMLFLLFFTLIPQFIEKFTSHNYPIGVTKQQILIQMQAHYNALIAEDIDNKETKLLAFFLDNQITQYDVITYSSLHNIYKGMENIAFGLSFIDGAIFVSIIFFAFLSSNLFIFPLAKNSFRQCVIVGANRRYIFLSKTIIIVSLSFVLSLFIGLLTFLIINSNCGFLTFYSYKDSFLLRNIGNIVISKTISMFLINMLFSYLTICLGLFIKKELATPMIIIVAFILLFFVSNYSDPYWGNYGELSGPSYNLLVFIPLSNLYMISSFGLIAESYIIYAIYFLLVGLLICLSYRKTLRISL